MITIPQANEKRDNFPCWKAVVDGKGEPLLPNIYCKCGQPLDIRSSYKQFVPPNQLTVLLNHPKSTGGCGFCECLILDGYADQYDKLYKEKWSGGKPESQAVDPVKMDRHKEKETVWDFIYQNCIAPRDEEIKRLTEWKDSAIKAMPDMQEIGKLMGVKLGARVPEAIIPYIKQQQERIKELETIVLQKDAEVEKFRTSMFYMENSIANNNEI